MREKRLIRMKMIRYSKISTVIIILLIVAGIISVHIAKLPMQNKQTMTVDLVEKYANFHDVSDFSKSNVDTVYYSVSGKNKDNQPSFAVVNKSMKHIKIFKQKDGISRSEAENIALSNGNQKIINSGLILVKGKPAWLISMQNNNGSYEYVKINFKNGQKIQVIKV